MKSAYTSTILRYVHDTVTGEFVNVGVALYSRETSFVGAVCRDTYSRLTRLFPGANGEAFKAMVRHVENAFAELQERFLADLPDLEERPNNVMEIANRVLPPDSSTLQWSPPRSGLTEDPAGTLERLYERLVAHYEVKSTGEHRSNEDVWRSFKRSLETRNLLRYFRPKVISSSKDEMEFKHAYKNGIWHCLEPLSFDLTTGEGIKDKARNLVGRMLALRESSEDFKLYLLIGKPRAPELSDIFGKAMSILDMIPGEREIYVEDEKERLGERMNCLLLGSDLSTSPSSPLGYVEGISVSQPPIHQRLGNGEQH